MQHQAMTTGGIERNLNNQKVYWKALKQAKIDEEKRRRDMDKDESEKEENKVVQFEDFFKKFQRIQNGNDVLANPNANGNAIANSNGSVNASTNMNSNLLYTHMSHNSTIKKKMTHYNDVINITEPLVHVLIVKIF